MRYPNEEEIKREILRGRKSLSSAKKLFEEELFEDAISRSYYSILHAAKAVLLTQDVRIDSHDAVKRLFGMYLVKTGKIDPIYSKILREEQDDRYLSDYDVAFLPEAEQVEKRIRDAEYFLDTMVEYLKKQGIDFSKEENDN